MLKQFIKDVIDEFAYLYCFGKKWDASNAEDERISKEKNEAIRQSIKHKKKIKWNKRKGY